MNLKLSFLVFLTSALTSIAPHWASVTQSSDPVKTESTQDVEEVQCELPEIRNQLAELVRLDQAARMEYIEATKQPQQGEQVEKTTKLRERLIEVDTENTEWLRKLVDVHGWPGKSKVGEDGAHNAWMLVQHADRQRDFQKKCLKLMGNMPEGEVAPIDLAYLTDRVLTADGQLQRYGTQCTINQDGKAEVKSVEDPENLDQRRKELGLPPISEYLKLVESMYSPKK